MKKIIIGVVLIAAVATAIFMRPFKTFPGSYVADGNDFNLNMVNEVFKLDFGSDVTIVDHSFSSPETSSYYDVPGEIAFKVIVEFPSDKKDAYYNMINEKYAVLTSEEESPVIFESIFSGRSIVPDAIFERFDTIITEKRYGFIREETRHPIMTLIWIENGGESTTVCLYTVGHDEGGKIVFSGIQN